VLLVHDCWALLAFFSFPNSNLLGLVSVDYDAYMSVFAAEDAMFAGIYYSLQLTRLKGQDYLVIFLNLLFVVDLYICCSNFFPGYVSH
jgi:hypothetical protein